MTKLRTLYDILEIKPSATAEQIRLAYLAGVKKYHPDRNPDNPNAKSQLLEVQDAYATLSHDLKRTLYDKNLAFSSPKVSKPTSSARRSHGTAEVHKETWKDFWDRESDSQKEARRERYKRYTSGERHDLDINLPTARWAEVRVVLIGFVGFWTLHYLKNMDEKLYDTNDSAPEDVKDHLVTAYYDPVQRYWAYIPAEFTAPHPQELYDMYKDNALSTTTLDFRQMPQSALTTVKISRNRVKPAPLLKHIESGSLHKFTV